ncbi:MAG: hypothetical protein JWM11_1238, partial [Planctomycetaceae bacterium]|nr:hypothetical protein [Planctomycetaceae bacterium]
MAKSGQTAPNILCTDLATFSQLDRSDAVCQLFESHWLIDETPEISRYLVLVPESERSRLFSRLVQIEVQYR